MKKILSTLAFCAILTSNHTFARNTDKIPSQESQQKQSSVETTRTETPPTESIPAVSFVLHYRTHMQHSSDSRLIEATRQVMENILLSKIIVVAMTSHQYHLEATARSAFFDHVAEVLRPQMPTATATDEEPLIRTRLSISPDLARQILQLEITPVAE